MVRSGLLLQSGRLRVKGMMLDRSGNRQAKVLMGAVLVGRRTELRSCAELSVALSAPPLQMAAHCRPARRWREMRAQ